MEDPLQELKDISSELGGIQHDSAGSPNIARRIGAVRTRVGAIISAVEEKLSFRSGFSTLMNLTRRSEKQNALKELEPEGKKAEDEPTK